MESLLLLLLLIPVLAVVGTVLGVMALLRVKRLAARVDELARELAGGGIALHHSHTPPPAGAEAPSPPFAAATAPAAAVPVAGRTASAELSPARPAVSPAPPAPPPPPQSASAVGDVPPDAAGPPARIDWEQWIGVRGAAVLGGVILAIAALLFFQYSIERGLISPSLRVILGVVVGLACMVGSGWLHRRQQEAAANALAGGGAVVLYAAIWAARMLYGLIGSAPAFVLMALVTVACGLLAARRSSLVIAVLGLAGGFATPLLVGTSSDQPITLFGYVLLLDAGLLWLARERRWGILAALSLAGTALHQGLWLFGAVDSPQAGLSLAVLAVFAMVFLASGRGEDGRETLLWRLTRSAGVMLPFAFSLQLAHTAPLGAHLAPLGALLALLAGCACWLSRRGGSPILEISAASFTLGVVAVWFLGQRPAALLSWEAVAVCAALSAVFQLAAEWPRESSPASDRSSAAVVLLACGFLVILIIAAASSSSALLWPWLAGWAAQSALLMRHAVRPGRSAVQVVAGVAPILGLFVFAVGHLHAAVFPSAPLFLAVVVGVAVLMQIGGVSGQAGRRRRWADHAAAATALTAMLPIVVFFDRRELSALPLLTATLVLGILAALAATRRASGTWLAVSAVTVAATQSLWTLVAWDSWGDDALSIGVLSLQLLSATVFTFWPALTRAAFSASRVAWLAGALSTPLWFPSLKLQWTAVFGDGAIAVLPLGLGALTLAAAALAGSALPQGLTVHRTALAWLLAVSLCFVSLAIPLQLDREWITIGWAVNGLAVIALWRRLDHPGLKYLGLLLLAAATVRLVANPAVLEYHPRGSLHVLNWLLYTYLVPAACLVLSARILKRHEAPRLRPVELKLLPPQGSVAAGLCGLAAVSVVFVWINLSIADIFAVSSELTLSFERLPARDLTTSISWALYALILLALGIRGASSPLRWLSLGLMLITIAKVFLHDLGELQDLYRVASLLGLAISLILVSLAYQRFVLRRNEAEES